MTPSIFFRGLTLIVFLIVVGYILETTDLGSNINKAWIDGDIRGQGLSGEMLFLFVGMLFTSIGLPRQAICFLGGYAFGLVEGTLLALLATTLGCITAFSYARIIGQKLVVKHFPGRVKNIDNFLFDNPLSMTLLIRLLPLGNNLVTNLAAGVSSVNATPFFLGSTIGYFPQTLVFSLIGSGISVDQELHIAISIFLFVISGLLGVSLYRKYRKGKSFDSKIEYKLGVNVDNGKVP